MQLGQTTAALEAFNATQTMQTAILAEGLQAISDAALNYSDMICTVVASTSVNLARMAQQNASVEALHLESTRADLDRHDTILHDLLRQYTQLQQEVHIPFASLDSGIVSGHSPEATAPLPASRAPCGVTVKKTQLRPRLIQQASLPQPRESPPAGGVALSNGFPCSTTQPGLVLFASKRELAH